MTCGKCRLISSGSPTTDRPPPPVSFRLQVRSVRNLSAQSGYSFFQLYPDPVYSPFEDEDGVKYYKSDYLTINVSRRGGDAGADGGGGGGQVVGCFWCEETRVWLRLFADMVARHIKA